MRPLRDPAPSRIAYRVNRLMLTPRFRLFLRYGLPSLALALATTVWFSDEARRGDLADRVAELRRQIEERPEFMVRMMEVNGASPGVAAEVRSVLPLDFPVSSFDLDLDMLRDRVTELDAVADASIRVRSGGVLGVEIDERQPVAVWRGPSGLSLIDAGGYRVAVLTRRSARADLPLVLGAGADRAIPEALSLLDTAEPILPRLVGLARVGERRWNVLLDRDQQILLPETGARVALEKVIALDRAQDLLARDIEAVDFRNPARPVLRLAPGAIETLHRTGITGDAER